MVFAISTSHNDKKGAQAVTQLRFLNHAPRKTVVVGHYGSGKTEFSVSLAMALASISTGKLALIDLDIINPYFRSREQRDMLEGAGICVHGSTYDSEITAEIPALGVSVRGPLEDSECRVIVDVGGNDAGALVLKQFSKYFISDTATVAVINANRPDTSTVDGTIEHITAIESATGLNITGIINNTHLLNETTASSILKGYELCMQVCNIIGKEFWCSCYPKDIIDPKEISDLGGEIFPLGLYMRPTWL